MGRSRAIPHSAEEDHNQSRSKRKRNASNVENLEPATADQEIAEGKKALYHCNYCNKDISGMIRIKCVMCPDFDLCVECFSVGAELNPHKSNHPYRVMDNLSFPLICSDWNADEEILLLEGIEMYGLGNWTEVAEHVGTKSKAQCIDHYNAIYMNSPCFPLPDMSHVMGKNREELLAMAKEHGEVNKGFPTLGELTVNDELLLSARIKVEDQRKEGSTGQSSSSLTSETGAGVVAGNTSTSAVKRASQIKDDHQDIKMEDSHADRSIGEKKLRTPGEEGPSMTRLSGYNPKRREFELEYDHDAEQLLADMEFKESDTDAERELKLRVLRIYLKRLDERKRRKDFVLERNLLYPDPFEKNLSPEEREICRRYRVFMRFHSKEVHEELLTSIIEEHRIMKIIQDLQEARAAGCRTSAQAEKYIEEKRKKEAEESACKSKDSAQAGPSGKFLQRAIHLKGEPDSSPRGNARGLSLSDSFGKDSSSTTPGQATSSSLLDSWDVNGFLGADLLSESAETELPSAAAMEAEVRNSRGAVVRKLFFGHLPSALPTGVMQWLVDVLVPTKAGDVRPLVFEPQLHFKDGWFRGCAHAFVLAHSTEEVLAALHHRVLFDLHGIWYARTPSEAQSLQQYCCMLRNLPQRQRHEKLQGLPCNPLACELTKNA